MAERLRMGVIGCGAIAQIMHIPYIAEYGEYFELVALADTHQPTLDAVADRYHVQQRHTDWRDLLARDDIDAVVICHGGSHRDTTIAALDANKHVFVEKPLTWNLREMQEVAARAASSDRIVQLGYHKLYDPAFAYTKAQVQRMSDLGFVRISVLHPANELGFSPHRIRRGNGIIAEGHVDVGTVDSQRADQLQAFAGGEMASLVDEALGACKDDARLRLGYGVLCSSFIHQIYTMYGFLGEPTRVVNADFWREGFSFHALVQYPGDLRVSLDWHFLLELKDYKEEYAFFGHKQRVMLTFPSPYFRNFPSPVTIQGGEGELSWEKHVTVSHDEAFRVEMLAFYDNVSKNQTPISSVADALKHSQFIQQVIDAAR
jgi:predicted dehydrogenase